MFQVKIKKNKGLDMDVSLIRLLFRIAKAESPENPQTTIGKVLYRSGYSRDRFDEDMKALTKHSRGVWKTEDPGKELTRLAIELITEGNRNPFDVFFAEPLMEYVRKAPGYNIHLLEEVASIVIGMNLPARVYSKLKGGSEEREWVRSVMENNPLPDQLFTMDEIQKITERVASGDLSMESLSSDPKSIWLSQDISIRYIEFSASPLVALIEHERGVYLLTKSQFFFTGEPPIYYIPAALLPRLACLSGLRIAANRIFGLVEASIPEKEIEEIADSIANRLMRNVYFPYSKDPGMPSEIDTSLMHLPFLLISMCMLDYTLGKYALVEEDEKRIIEKIVEKLKKSDHPNIRMALSYME